MKATLALVLAVALTGGAAVAETFRVRAQREFKVGDTVLPAGQYYIHTDSAGDAAPTVLISSAEGREVRVPVVRSDGSHGRARLVLKKRGTELEWVRVVGGGVALDFAVAPSPVEVGQ
jgi:hypothetical protein